MPVYQKSFHCQAKGFCDLIDITSNVQEILTESGIQNGIACVAVPGSTAGITTIEYESGALQDLRETIERLLPEKKPSGKPYHHDSRWGDGNGFSHVRAAMMGGSYSVPVQDGKLRLGTWQQLILADFDNRPRNREVIVQLLGE